MSTATQKEKRRWALKEYLWTVKVHTNFIEGEMRSIHGPSITTVQFHTRMLRNRARKLAKDIQEGKP